MLSAVYVVGPDCLSLPILVPCLYIQQPEMPSVIDWSSQNPTQPTYPKYILRSFSMVCILFFCFTWLEYVTACVCFVLMHMFIKRDGSVQGPLWPKDIREIVKQKFLTVR